MIEIRIEQAGINVPLLHREIKQALADKFIGLAGYDDHVIIKLQDDTTEQECINASAVAAQHDGTAKTPEQVILNVSRDALANLRAQIGARIDWHEANPATTSNAVQVAQRMQQEWILFLKKLRAEL